MKMVNLIISSLSFVYHLHYLNFTHMMLSTLLILAVCRMRVTYDPSNGLAHQGSFVEQWLECPTSIWDAMGLIPVFSV